MATRKSASKKSSSKSSKKGGRKYGPKAQKSVEREMHAFKEGKLKSGSGRKVTNPRQAIAIGLSEARKEGDKVPPPPRKSARKKSAKKSSAKKSTSRKTSSKKSSARKSTSSRSRKTAKKS
jgi:hypothetical protein